MRCLYSPRGCAVWSILFALLSVSLLTFLAVRLPTSLLGCGPLQLGVIFFLFILALSLFFVVGSQVRSLGSDKWSWQPQVDAPPGVLLVAPGTGATAGLEMSQRASIAPLDNGEHADDEDATLLLQKRQGGHQPHHPAAVAAAGTKLSASVAAPSPFATSKSATCFRVLFCSLCIISVGILIGVASLLIFLRGKTLPDYESTLSLPGLAAPVNLYREQQTGILHISASSEDDLFFAQGFAQAQTRMWQLEFQRRVGAGRLSEIVGEGGLDIDKTMRTLGLYAAAERAVNQVSPYSLNILTRFAAGVNAYIDLMQQNKVATPLEMLVIPGAGYTVEPWRPADSLVWSKVMALSLAGNFERELMRFELFVKQNVTVERIYELFPIFDTSNFPTILSNEDLQPPYFPGNFTAVKEWSAMYGQQTNVDSFLGATGSTNAPIMAALTNARNLYQQSLLKAQRRGEGLLTAAAPVEEGNHQQDEDFEENIRVRRRALRDSEAKEEEGAPISKRSLLNSALSLLSPINPSSSLSRFAKSFISRRTGAKPGGGARASNSWVVGGKITKSGLPLLNNDPHLQLMAPSIWMLTHLSSPNINVMGSCFPGIPGVVLGRAFTKDKTTGANRTVAWGVTNTLLDVQDLYIMQDKPGDDAQYFYQGSWKPYNVSTAVIKVAGGDDVNLRLRQSVYGTVITDNDVYHGYGSSLALRWVSTDPSIPDTTMDAFFGLMSMTSYADFRQSLSSYVGPSQNFIFADDQGNIGYQTSGYLPHRAPNLGYTGALPVPGDGQALFEWSGRVPFDVMPATFNPSKGFVATANNRVVPVPNSVNPGDGSSYNIFLTSDWDEGSDGYRAQRITNMIQASSSHDASSMQGIQQDYTSGWARDLSAAIAALPASFLKTSGGLGLKNRLGNFNSVMSIGSRTATLQVLVWQELAKLGAKEAGGTYWGDVIFLRNALSSDARNATDVACLLEGFSSCNAYLASVLDGVASRHAITDAASGTPAGGDTVSGSDTATLRWGIDVHKAIAVHQILDGSPLQCLADRTISHGGDDFTVDVGPIAFDGEEDKGMAAEIRFAQLDGSSFRHISDLGNPEATSKIVNFMGENGAILAEGNIGVGGNTAFDAELGQWAYGGYSTMTMDLTRLDTPLVQSLNPA